MEDKSPVKFYTSVLQDLLSRVHSQKPINSIEPPLTASDFGEDLERIEPNRQYFAAIETACRDLFYDLVASADGQNDASAQIWNFLDIISILSDNLQCDPALIFWLIEEFLDSQTIEGCKTIFDYLESRRERLISKHFDKKNLVILRSCNELLRRLSRAEDTVFCGRVFIFMFQSFPLGDKSSVNLRGECHTENATVYDEATPQKAEENGNKMDVDDVKALETVPTPDSKGGSTPLPRGISTPGRAEKVGDKAEETGMLDLNRLYPIFWSLQKAFSNPTTIFQEENFQKFKTGLQATILRFQEAQRKQEGRGTSHLVEDKARGLKRKRGDEDSDQTNGYSPKFLTSRDLFELEINDVAFRRYILVQALILIDFLLALTPQAKAKLMKSNPVNKSVLYPYILGEEDTKWATETKASIATYLREGPEGHFYYRMVETVLSRDKNWVRWKASNCPPIQRLPFSATQWTEARDGMKMLCQKRRLKPLPTGAIDVSFLEDTGNDGFEALKDEERFRTPTIDALMMSMMDDEMDMGRADTDEAKLLVKETKASKSWRALRLASKNRLNRFDKIDENAEDLRALTAAGDTKDISISVDDASAT